MNRLNLNLKIQALTGDMTCAELRHLIKSIEDCRSKQRAGYELSATGEVCRVTHALARNPIESVYADAIEEATTRPIDWTTQEEKIKKHARHFRQPFNRDEVTVWARQHLLAVRTYLLAIIDHPNTEPYGCPVCERATCAACKCPEEEDQPLRIVILKMGSHAGPFCPKCLRRVPRTWYLQE